VEIQARDHQGDFLNYLSIMLSCVADTQKRKSAIKKNIYLEDAQTKMREAKRAFDKLSEQQRNMIHLTIQDTQVPLLHFRDAPGSPDLVHDTEVTAIEWPRPEAMILGIVKAFAILTGENPHPLPHGEGAIRDYPFRDFMLRLQRLVESCDGQLYCDSKAPCGGPKFKAVVDILRARYPDFVPEKLRLKSIEEDWRKDKKSRRPPNRR
jgi:hypothetical protein